MTNDFGIALDPNRPLAPKWRKPVLMGAVFVALISLGIVIPVNQQITHHQNAHFASFENLVEKRLNSHLGSAKTCKDSAIDKEKLRIALDHLKRNPVSLSEKVELPVKVLGLKLLWGISVLDTLNGPECLWDQVQKIDECRAIELIMQGQDYDDLRSDLSIANKSTGWASDIHKKLLGLLWQGNHIRTEPAPCPNCRTFISQPSEDWCEKIVVTAMGKEQFIESFNRAASKRNNQNKSKATSDMTEHFQSRVQNLRGTAHMEAKQLLQDPRAVTLGKRLVTTQTPLGKLTHEVPEWTPNFAWADKELTLLERTNIPEPIPDYSVPGSNLTRSNSKNASGQGNAVTKEMDDCYTIHRPNRPWAHIYPKVGICGEPDFEQIQVSTLHGEQALFVIASDNGEIINHRLLRSNSSAMMRVGPANYYTVFIIIGNEFSYSRRVPEQTNKLYGFFKNFNVMTTRVYVGPHVNHQFSTASSRMRPSNLRAVFN